MGIKCERIDTQNMLKIFVSTCNYNIHVALKPKKDASGKIRLSIL